MTDAVEVVTEDRTGATGYDPRGAALALWRCKAPEVVIAGPAETGKAQPLDSTVWTPGGPVRMGDIQPGDEVCTPGGGCARVRAVFPQGEQDVYRLTFTGGATAECTGDHLWEVRWMGGGKRNGQKPREMTAVRRLKDILGDFAVGKRRRPKYWTRMTCPLALTARPVPIPPYVLGVLLGDGCLRAGTITFASADAEIVAAVSAELGPEYRIKHVSNYDHAINANGWHPRRRVAKRGYTGRHVFHGRTIGFAAYTRRPGGGVSYLGFYASRPLAETAIAEYDGETHSADDLPHGLWYEVAQLGLEGKKSWEKFVPAVYKHNAAPVRLAILQGLMDTDGTVDRKTGMPSFTSTSPRLARDVCDLVESLGGFCSVTTKKPPNGRLAYTCWIRHPDARQLFRLERKLARVKDRTKYPVKRMLCRVDLVGRKPCQCISVDTVDGLYVTDSCIVTHNTRAALEKLDGLLRKYKGAQAVMVRKVRDTINSTCLQTFIKKVLLSDGRGGYAGVKVYGGEKPQWFDYSRGSRLWIAGIDDPGKALSSERDFIYCFVGGTRVECPSPVVRSFRRRYSGLLVTIRTAGDNQLTGTPNHPVLTDQGWVALGRLKVGDYVISRGRRQEMAARHPDVDNRPAVIAEVHRSLAESPAGRAACQRVAGVDVDFHGDGGNGHIDVVAAGGLLQCRRQPAILQPVGHHPVRGARLNGANFKGLGPRFEVFFRPRLAAGGLGGHGGEPGGEHGVTAPAVVGGLAARQWLQPATQQLGFNDAVTDSDARAYGDHPALAIEVSPDRIVNVSLARTDPATITHVYNLETISHYYIAGNVIVHNCNQAEELSHDDWQVLTTRATGRAGNAPYGQVFGDCNPGPPFHWIKNRPTLTLLESRHEDNPTLYDETTGEWTEQGKRTLAVLDGLTGVRKQRLRHGRWVSAEGTVYEFDTARHVVTFAEVVRRGLLTPDGRRGPAARWAVAGVDWGYTAPGVLGVWLGDSDGRMVLVWEQYRTRELIGWWVEQARVARDLFRPEAFACDPSEPAYVAEFVRAGLPAVAADNDRKPGIQEVSTRLSSAPDGRPRLSVMAGATQARDETLAEAKQPASTEQEFDAFVWKKYPDGRVNKEETAGPDHGMDQTRYTAMYAKAAYGHAGPAIVLGGNLVEQYGGGL